MPTASDRVFVVVRFDSQWLQYKDERLFTVIEVLPDEESAVREVDRLNTLNGSDEGPRYSFQSARWYMRPNRLLRIIQVTSRSPPAVKTDAYIPLEVRWVPPRLRQRPPPVYVRLSGIAGGGLELTIERESGQLLGLTVLELGAIVPASPASHPVEEREAGCGVVMDRTLWDDDDRNVIEIEMLLRSYRLGDGFRISIAGAESQRIVSCGPRLTLGLATDGVLASITSTLSVSESHFRS